MKSRICQHLTSLYLHLFREVDSPENASQLDQKLNKTKGKDQQVDSQGNLQEGNGRTVILKQAKEVLQIEAEGIMGVVERLDSNFVKMVDLIYACKGRVILTGIG